MGFLIFNLSVNYAEDGSCSKDGQDCGAELKSGMVEQTIDEDDITKEDDDDDEGIVEETEGEKIQDEIDDTEEVDGAFEPCTKIEMGGQLYKLMIQNAGYKLTDESKMLRVHCQAESDDFFANGCYQTTGHFEDAKVLVVAMMPSQGLQPHAHDLTEDVTLGWGELKYFTWLDGPGHPSNRTVKAGSCWRSNSCCFCWSRGSRFS